MKSHEKARVRAQIPISCICKRGSRINIYKCISLCSEAVKSTEGAEKGEAPKAEEDAKTVATAKAGEPAEEVAGSHYCFVDSTEIGKVIRRR